MFKGLLCEYILCELILSKNNFSDVKALIVSNDINNRRFHKHNIAEE